MKTQDPEFNTSDKNNIAEQLPPLWNAFLSRLDEIGNKRPGTCYGVYQQTKQDSDQLEYFATIGVKKVEQTPSGFGDLWRGLSPDFGSIRHALCNSATDALVGFPLLLENSS